LLDKVNRLEALVKPAIDVAKGKARKREVAVERW
jgi:hypothetical protein